jgi:hypothetical protein
MWWDGGMLNDFVMSQQVKGEEEDEWIDIVRIDCSHQEVHIHRFDVRDDDESTRRILRSITSPGDATLDWRTLRN